jgi:hypothetical protein
MERELAAVLWLAADDLPPMPAHQGDVARYLLQAGYYLVRTGREQVWDLVAALQDEEHPAARPRH